MSRDYTRREAVLAAAVCGAHAMEILTFDSHGSCIEVVQDFDIAASRDSCSLPHVGGKLKPHISRCMHILYCFSTTPPFQAHTLESKPRSSLHRASAAKNPLNDHTRSKTLYLPLNGPSDRSAWGNNTVRPKTSRGSTPHIVQRVAAAAGP